MKVLLAVDDHGRNFEAVADAATWFPSDSEVVALHVRSLAPAGDMQHALAAAPAYGYASAAELVSPYPYPAEDAPGSSDDPAEHAQRVAEEAAGIAEAEPRIEVGDPAATIVSVAAQIGADVVVVGAGDRSWLSRLFSPSVSDRVLRDAPCSVLVVRGTGPTARGERSARG